MHGIKIDISFDLLLEYFGLPKGNIHLHHTTVNRDESFSIFLSGDDERLPVMHENGKWPEGIIECTRIEAKIKAY